MRYDPETGLVSIPIPRDPLVYLALALAALGLVVQFTRRRASGVVTTFDGRIIDPASLRHPAL